MRHRILPFLLAAILGAAAMTACSSAPDKIAAGEAVNRVYPAGDGRYFDTSSEADVSADPSAAASTASTTKPSAKATQATTAPKAKTKSTSSSAASAASSATQPTTLNVSVPNDEITADNINPRIGSIQSEMQQQIIAHSVTSISLSATSIDLNTGETKTLDISFTPADAVNKICTVTASNGNVRASVSGKTVSITGVTAGTSTITVTSNNGHKATCDITVKRVEQDITDDTVLTHKDIVTAANAERWTAAVISHLESLGMTRNTSLQGDSFSMGTDGVNNVSYNEAALGFINLAENEATSITGQDWSDYEFNCVCSARDGEFDIIVAINIKFI